MSLITECLFATLSLPMHIDRSTRQLEQLRVTFRTYLNNFTPICSKASPLLTFICGTYTFASTFSPRISQVFANQKRMMQATKLVSGACNYTQSFDHCDLRKWSNVEIEQRIHGMVKILVIPHTFVTSNVKESIGTWLLAVPTRSFALACANGRDALWGAPVSRASIMVYVE